MKKKLLNVGAGPTPWINLPAGISQEDWEEIRLDINPDYKPDVLGSMLDMSAVADGSVDAVYSSHSIEHLYVSELPKAFAEFLRVLKADGVAIINCPDLQAAAQWIAQDKLLEVAYVAGSGVPVTPFDLVFAHRSIATRDNPYMAHHCGFTLTTLMGTLKANGFKATAGIRGNFDLWVVASKAARTEADMTAVAEAVLGLR